MEKFFSLLGKIVLVFLLLGSIAYGAYSLGKSSQPGSNTGAASTTAMPTPTMDPGLKPESLPEGFKPAKTITAGLGTESGLSFTKYQITVPEGWIPDHVTTNEGTWADTLTLTKGTTKLKIFQAATGGALCLYPSDPDFEGPSSRYDMYVTITTSDGIILRRGNTKGSTGGYTMCQKGSENYGQPTVFGHMNLTTTLGSEDALLTEADAMIASLKKL